MKVRNVIMSLALIASAQTALSYQFTRMDNSFLFNADTLEEFIRQTIIERNALAINKGRIIDTEENFNAVDSSDVRLQFIPINNANNKERAITALQNASIPEEEWPEALQAQPSTLPTDAEIAQAARDFCANVPL